MLSRGVEGLFKTVYSDEEGLGVLVSVVQLQWSDVVGVNNEVADGRHENQGCEVRHILQRKQ